MRSNLSLDALPPQVAAWRDRLAPPTLIALVHYSGNARTIVQSYPSRGILVNVEENYDVRLAKVRGAGAPTPPFSSNEVFSSNVRQQI